MALKITPLGSSTTTAAGLTISGSTNATPIVVTFAAGHGLSDGKRTAISGVTGNTNANGMWTLQFTGANTARLLGSVGNGVHGGTVRVGVVNDVTPLMRSHSAVFRLTGNHVGVVDVEVYGSYADFAAGANTEGMTAPFPLGTAGVANSNGSVSTPARSTITTAATNPSFTAEMQLPLIMRMVPTTATSGTLSAVIEA
jgi:hypothetical protein